MMHGPEKSDPAILGMKPANKPGRTGAESVDRRAGAKENASETCAGRTLGWETASSSLERVRERARQDQKVKFTALLHHVDVELLRKAFLALKRKAAPGVDGVTWHDYEQDLETKLVDLHARVHRGAYRAQPSRRRLIPKEDGRQRPLGVTALEDKIVQRAVVEVLNAIYEPVFLGFSYGFRRGRSQHNALDALAFGITRTRVSFQITKAGGFESCVFHRTTIAASAACVYPRHTGNPHRLKPNNVTQFPINCKVRPHIITVCFLYIARIDTGDDTK
jgi:RNA-directed DNA polymerase